jgi:hypothetical protein
VVDFEYQCSDTRAAFTLNTKKIAHPFKEESTQISRIFCTAHRLKVCGGTIFIARLQGSDSACPNAWVLKLFCDRSLTYSLSART